MKKYQHKQETKLENEDVIRPEKASMYGDIAADDQYSCSEIDSECDSLNRINPMEQMLYGLKQKKIKKRQRVNSGSIHPNEDSHCSASTHTDNSLFKSHNDADHESLYVLKRDSGSFHSRGYLFLAVAFGMMAYQSYSGQEKPDLSSPQIQTMSIPNQQ